MKGKLVKLTNYALLLPMFAFPITVSAENQQQQQGSLSQAIQSVGSDVANASTQVISSGAKVMALIMFILFFVFPLGGGLGAWFWYTKTRGNPQQPADTRVAGLMAGVGVIAGLIVWVILYYVIKNQLGIDVVQIIRNSVR